MSGQGSGRRAASREESLRLARGEITLAEYAGLTRAELYAVAREAYRLMGGGRLAEALIIYRGLAAADPYDSVFRCHLAAALLRTGDAEGALTEFDAALRLNVANGDALSGRGEARLRLGQFSEAVKDLTAAVALDPKAARPSTARALSLLNAVREAARQKKSAAAPRNL
ncbi:MAG TPA: tetratricopeptide repeat protein [Pyrinomonadaceae bacterium]|jgi:tetratricopeptide (TPR) repeat protein|nr:tetratricopeptide repeat protein [Pyrinomonadaceae bacterium]